MSSSGSLLSSDGVFVAGLLFHTRDENGIGRFRLQKIGFLTYTELPSSIQNELNISYDTAWMGKRDLLVDRILSWLVQSGLATKTHGDVFGDEYTHRYELSYDGVDAYTEMGNKDHVLTRTAEKRVDPDTVIEINNIVKETNNKYSDALSEELLNKVMEKQEAPQSDIADLF